jgi:D-glucosaminate-6-phosphate ammonia-lyase
MPIPTTDSRAILESLGLIPVINAAGFPSRLGGATLSPAVRAAMDAAAQSFIPIAEMQARASEIIAEATGAEAGLVASGGAACLTLAAAACITGDDPGAVDRLPDTTGLRNEIAVHRAHRNPFDHAIRVPGARFVEFGYLGVPAGVGAYRWQLDAAITDKTAAVFYFGQPTAYVLPLVEVVEVAHARGVPVIVDAAGTMPPVSNLRRFIAEGADLVAFSGGKLVRGPAASGFLAGHRRLIRAATIQHQDAFVHPDVYQPPFAEPGSNRPAEPPHQGLGRVLKVGREEIAGLMVALQAFVKRDHAAEQRSWEKMSETIAADLRTVNAKGVTITTPTTPWVHVVITFPHRAHAARTAAALQTGRPRIFVAAHRISNAELVVIPQNLNEEEVPVLTTRLREAIEAAARP